MNGIDYIAQILKQEGVEIITCYPNNPLIEAAAIEGIRPVAFRHERGAIMAADGISRTTENFDMSPPNSSSRLMAQGDMYPGRRRRGMPYSSSSNMPMLSGLNSPSGLSKIGLISSPVANT